MSWPLVVVQNNPAVDRLTAPVSRHARSVGHDLLDLDLREGFTFDAVDADFAGREAVLLHGSVAFLKAALRRDDLAARLSWREDAFMASAWGEAFGPGYLGHGGKVAPADEIGRMLDRGGRLAVRPELGLKGFKGGVYDSASWRMAGIASDVRCFAAPPTRLLSEHRVWMVGGEPVAASLYMRDGRLEAGLDGVAEAMASAARLTTGRLPLTEIVVDVAMTTDGWRIVEMNCIHTSGWYAADAGTVVDALVNVAPTLASPFGPP